LRGRGKGEKERIILLAHQTEVMARQKRLKPPEHYLNGASRQPRAKLGAGAVVTALAQAEKRGLNVTVRRITQRKEQP